MKLFGGLKVQVMKKIRTINNIATNQYDYKSINISYMYKCTYIYIYVISSLHLGLDIKIQYV